MSTQTHEQPANPFSSRGEYTSNAVELMRAMSEYRQQVGVQVSSPAEVLSVVRSLGYDFNGDMVEDDQTRLFELAIARYKKQEKIAHPTCDDVIKVVERIGFTRDTSMTATVLEGGMPIDRRRREADERKAQAERRSSLEPSPQELLDLTDEENQFLDRLKALREATGREFASSEELLSIAWGLGYRPTSEDGFATEWLDDEQRCQTQIQFTQAVESRLAEIGDDEFLTCRGLLAIIDQIGFRLA